jgi:K+-sensing histidine kinase KdpD
VGKGTGLGLGICAGILQGCGGTIRAWNDPDGVSFEVTLPPSTDASAEQHAGVGAAVADEGQEPGHPGE